ncbi:MAG: hypothetical protein JO250_10945 [Armatimonadetes bacterium]|nr:hypothetical protein [Armatimonadota bacterium]
MPHLLHTALLALLWYVGFMYLVAPLIVRFNQRMSASPRFEPLDWTRVPPEARQYLIENAGVLEALGFQAAAYVASTGMTANVLPLLIISINRVTGEKAMTAVFYALSQGTARLTARYVEFTTWFADGRSLDTSNNSTARAFASSPDHPLHRFPMVSEPAQLLAVHRRLSQQFEEEIENAPPAVTWHFTHRMAVTGTNRVLPRPGEEVAELAEVVVASYDRQCHAGRLYLDAAAGAYRPTLRGAYLMTWGLLWPVTVLRRAVERRRAIRVLRALGAASGLKCSSA